MPPQTHPLFPRSAVYLQRNSPKNFIVMVMVQRHYGARWITEARVENIANVTEARAAARAFVKTFEDLYGKEVERVGW